MKLLFILLFGLSIFSCSREEGGLLPLEKIVSAQSKISATKYVNSREVIDLPYTVNELKNPATKFSDDEVAKLKAVAFKFYSNVKLKDGYYSLSASKGEDIQISDKLFNLMKLNIEHVNKFIEDNAKKGIPTQLPEITQETLNTLLK